MFNTPQLRFYHTTVLYTSAQSEVRAFEPRTNVSPSDRATCQIIAARQMGRRKASSHTQGRAQQSNQNPICMGKDEPYKSHKPILVYIEGNHNWVSDDDGRGLIFV
ncbi:hypothetical protein GN956_G3135 [Arapaima gigas]